jgi:tyrosinase
MKKKPLKDPTSWRFYGAIHGFTKQMWESVGYWSASEPQPQKEDVQRFWLQCQHGSWYFLPWHRGYLLALEANIRSEIAKLPGAPADWALPYWNYFKPNEFKLPPAFASPDWPDGKGDNPLFVRQRYGSNDNGDVYVPVQDINLDAMSDPDFTGVTSAPGFGGVDTGFEHGGATHGGIETQPHDYVHGLVGGGTRQKIGLMSWPQTAGLDPIFWLHHANIDRLWEAWVKSPTSTGNPTDSKWVKGPSGPRKFSMPMPDGKDWNYVPGDMTDLTKLGYTYDDLSLMVPIVQPNERLMRLGASQATAKAKGVGGAVSGKKVELVGASQGSMQIVGNESSTSVQLDKGVRNKVSASLKAAATEAVAPPDRVFLNLENVRGLEDSTAFRVYVGLSQGAKPGDHPERLAGSIALFGVSKATQADEEHAGQGLNFALEITKIVDALHLGNQLDVDKLDVRIVPVRPVPEDAKISVGRVSIYRQGR